MVNIINLDSENCDLDVMTTHKRNNLWQGSKLQYRVVSWSHWTPSFPSIRLGVGDPPHPRCQMSVWRRRNRSGRPLETSHCLSRCHYLNRQEKKVDTVIPITAGE